MKHPNGHAFREILPVREFRARCWVFPVFCPDCRQDSYRGYSTVSGYQAAVTVKEAEVEGSVLRAAESKCHNRENNRHHSSLEYSNLQDTYQA